MLSRLLFGLQIAICANEPTLSTGNLLRKLIYSITLCCGLCNVKTGGLSVDLRDLKPSASGGKPPLFSQRARYARQPLHAFPADSAAGRRFGQPLFVRDNRTVTLTEARRAASVCPTDAFAISAVAPYLRSAGAVPFRATVLWVQRPRIYHVYPDRFAPNTLLLKSN